MYLPMLQSIFLKQFMGILYTGIFLRQRHHVAFAREILPIIQITFVLYRQV